MGSLPGNLLYVSGKLLSTNLLLTHWVTLRPKLISFFQRSILHDVCEVAGLVAYSFGEEDVDRHTVVWKKEAAPAEEELACLRQDGL